MSNNVVIFEVTNPHQKYTATFRTSINWFYGIMSVLSNHPEIIVKVENKQVHSSDFDKFYGDSNVTCDEDYDFGLKSGALMVESV